MMVKKIGQALFWLILFIVVPALCGISTISIWSIMAICLILIVFCGYLAVKFDMVRGDEDE